MSAWEGTRLETILRASGRDVIINTGAWTNMSVEHTRAPAPTRLLHRTSGELLLDDERRLANPAINYALQNARWLPRPTR